MGGTANGSLESNTKNLFLNNYQSFAFFPPFEILLTA
jgi:hypothetical protein